jgi:hypothetical protein
MKIHTFKPGMTVYSVLKRRIGNTTLSTVNAYTVTIESVDAKKGVVYASWNGNPVRAFSRRGWSKWRHLATADARVSDNQPPGDTA